MPRTTFVNPTFHPERPWLLRPVRVDPEGAKGPTPKQARGPRVRRTSCGLYVVGSEAPAPEQRAIDAWSGLVLDGWVTGWAALRWWGGYWFDGLGPDGVRELPVPLVSSIDQTPTPPGSRIVRDRLSDGDHVVHLGLPVTTAVRSLFHEVVRARALRDRVIAIDLAAYNDLVSLAEFATCLARHRGWRGIRRARAALALASENSLSPREPRLRMALQSGGIPSLEVNVPVFSAGKHLGTPDLFDAEAGLVIEYDGAVHLEAGRRRRDRDREEAFRRVGLEFVTVLGGDSDEAAVRRVAEARRRARWAAPDERRWTLEAPHWWVSTETVAQRRALPPDLRAVWLNLRRSPGPPSALGSPS